MAGRPPVGNRADRRAHPRGWVIGRIQTNGASDYGAVHAIQDGLRATPLSRWPGPAVEPEGTTDPELDMATAPIDQVMSLPGPHFMEYATDLLTRHPAHPIDQPMLARMARLGLRPGTPFRAADAAPEVLAAIERAPATAQARIGAAAPRVAPLVNGWAIAVSGMGACGADYLRRAVIAKIGLGANLAADAVYPLAFLDEDGAPPNGDHDYVLHFAAGELPPAGAFWSATMYDGDGFPVPNTIGSHALGDRDPLRFNPDGSLDLYLYHEDPGDELRANWLPAPRGPIGVTLRLYDPEPAVLDGTWAPPPLRRR